MLGSGDPSRLYLCSAFFDPSFQNKLAFGITFAATVLATSFSLGYLILESYFWIEIKTRWIYLSTLRWLREKGITPQAVLEDFEQIIEFFSVMPISTTMPIKL